MKKLYSLIIITLFSTFQSFKCFSTSDSLYPFTEKEILKLSNLIYDLEKRDSAASADEPNGFGLKDQTTISDPSLIVDVNNDSIHYYTGKDVVKLSNYIFELERRDSIRMAKDSLAKLAAAVEYHMEEEDDLRNFESAIFFNLNSTSITPESFVALDDIVDILTSYININFVIEGYTDDTGSPSYNKVLSIRRARAVKEYFVKKGIDASRIVSVTGLGGDKYLYPNDTEENKAKNRNVIIKAYH